MLCLDVKCDVEHSEVSVKFYDTDGQSANDTRVAKIKLAIKTIEALQETAKALIGDEDES